MCSLVGIVKIVVVLAYVAMMLGIGYWSMRRTRNVGDFFIGGRTIGPWISAMAYGTTYFSAVVFVGFAGKLGWAFGPQVLWIAAGNAIIGTYLAWRMLAIPTREMTERLDAITMPEFLEARYGLPWLRPLSALVVFVFLVPYSASVYQGLGHLFDANMGIGYVPAIIFMAGITGVYLVMGGYFAVTTTDFIQGLMQVFGVTFMILLLAQATGYGVIGAATSLSGAENAPALAPNPDALFPGWVLLISLVFMTSVGPWGLPQMVQKFYSIKSRHVVQRGMIIATAFSVLIAFGAYYCGSLSHHFYASGADLPQGPNGPAFDKIVPEMLTAHTPAWFSVVILLVVLAASMSTLASLVLVSSAAIAVDLFHARDRHDKSSKRGLLLMRALCGLFVALSVIIAATRPAGIVDLMSMSWGALAGAFIGPYVWGVFSRRTTAAGGAAGFILGLCSAVVLFYVWGVKNSPIAATTAMVISLVTVPLISLVTPRLPTALVAKAFDRTQEAETVAENAANQEVLQ